MIKRIRLASRNGALAPAAFAEAWPSAAGAAGGAPAGARPDRIAVCTTLTDLSGADPRHDGIALEWFTDAAHLARFEAWLDTPAGRAATAAVEAVVATDASPVIIADELVIRGADWLPERWAAGGDRFKHVSIARRSENLTPAEFSQRWRGHAGRVAPPGADRPVAIPERVQGLAYVQNHPVVRASGDWAYDAINEVYFDDPGALRERIAWFRENLPDRNATDFVSRSWFLAAREEVVA